jgi:sec-independent protein translocase protein TatA
MFGLGPWELIIIALILLLLFGAKRIPEIGKGIGGAIREFRNVKKELNSSPPEQREKSAQADSESEDKNKPETLEHRMAGKLAEQMPGVRKAMGVKKKVDQARRLMD